MSLPFSGPVTNGANCCERIPGTFPPDLAPYVRSINSLQGIILIDGSTYIDVGSTGNTISISLDVDALIPIIIAAENGDALEMEGGLSPGTGTVQSVTLSSSTLSIGGTNPITSDGTITVNLTGATASIQGLTTAANKMIYTTASNVYAVTDLSVFARTFLDDASGAAVCTTIGAQPLSADLTTFVTVATWTGSNLNLAGNLEVDDLVALATTLESLTVENITVTDSVTITGAVGITGAVTATSFTGIGTGLTALTGSNITAGAVPAANGGTGHAGGFTIGDLLYATASGTLSKLADVSVGSFLRSGGVATAPAWSAVKWPNTLVVGDLLYADTTTNVNRLADVATTNVLLSGGVGVAPSWGKVTAAHATGLAGSGNNTNITAFTGTNISFNDGATFVQDASFDAGLLDTLGSAGTSGQVLTSTGTEVQWGSVSLAFTTGVAGSGANSNISSFVGTNIEFSDGATFSADTTFAFALIDGASSPGTSGQILKSTGSEVAWSSDLNVDDLRIDATLSVEGTITPGGSTGTVTIDKPSGTVRIAAAGSSVTVNNSLCSTSSRIMAVCSSNDATAYVKSVAPGTGSFVVTLGASSTGEVEISWILFNIT